MMKKNFFLVLIISLFIYQHSNAQVFYVDSRQGNDISNGSYSKPFKTISKAVEKANELTDENPISIKILPGLYVLNDKIVLKPKGTFDGSNRFTIEAYIMPDDTNWIPEKMPVIVSYSTNNSTLQFPHAAGFLVSVNNVTIKGLKFIGNPNPEVPFYYPITRADTLLNSLEISQCFFIAEKNSSIIQGGIWAHGHNININHCVFYNCRNAILLFRNINGCSITNNLIYGAYESALWIAGNDPDFVFKNNVITGGDFFWVKGTKSTFKYKITDCVIANNLHYYGGWSSKEQQIIEIDEYNLSENNILKTGKINLVERTGPGFPHNYLHLTSKSIGSNLNAGVFIDE